MPIYISTSLKLLDVNSGIGSRRPNPLASDICASLPPRRDSDHGASRLEDSLHEGQSGAPCLECPIHARREDVGRVKGKYSIVTFALGDMALSV